METQPIPIEPGVTLEQRLKAAADAWCRAQDTTLARLGRMVVNDSKFFTTLESSRKGPSTATLQQFARFLIDPANWPSSEAGRGNVAAEAVELAHVTGVSAPVAGLSAGNGPESSREAAA